VTPDQFHRRFCAFLAANFSAKPLRFSLGGHAPFELEDEAGNRKTVRRDGKIDLSSGTFIRRAALSRNDRRCAAG